MARIVIKDDKQADEAAGVLSSCFPFDISGEGATFWIHLRRALRGCNGYDLSEKTLFAYPWKERNGGVESPAVARERITGFVVHLSSGVSFEESSLSYDWWYEMLNRYAWNMADCLLYELDIWLPSGIADASRLVSQPTAFVKPVTYRIKQRQLRFA